LKYYCVINKTNKKISYGDTNEQTAKDYLAQFCDDTCELITLETEPLTPKVGFRPIVAHVIIKNKDAKNKLIATTAGGGNEFYIDYIQSLRSYNIEQFNG
jgi:hypothetical protein